MSLPVRTDIVPLDLRRANALFDLSQVNEAAVRSNELRQYAEEAAQAVFMAGATQELHPKAEALQTLFLEMCVGEENMPEVDVAAMRREKITPAQVSAPVSSDVVRGLLSDLHPDKKVAESELPASDVVDTEAETYKLLSGAKKRKDQLTEQSVLASALSERVLCEPDNIGTETIELVRYRAMVALEAGRTKFSSLEEVEAWREQQIKLLPIQQRGRMLVHITGLFFQTLNPAPDGSVTLRGESADFMKRTLEEAQEQAQMMIDDVKSARFLGETYDREQFDRSLDLVIKQLEDTLQQHRDWRQVYLHSQVEFCRALSLLCANGPLRTQRLGRYAMGLLGGGTKKRGDGYTFGDGSLSNEYYKEPLRDKEKLNKSFEYGSYDKNYE